MYMHLYIIMQVCLPGLHITLGVFHKMFELFEQECHNLDLQFAMQGAQEHTSTKFSEYSSALQKLFKSREQLHSAKDEATMMEQCATYSAVVVRSSDPVVCHLMQQAESARKSVTQLVCYTHAQCLSYLRNMGTTVYIMFTGEQGQVTHQLS